MSVSEFVLFGPDQRLSGILTGAASATGATLVLPSAGLQPRGGPFRLHCELAERLALRGIRTFRFDVPGVGEAPRLNGCDAHAATLAAIDALEARHGCSNFVVGGLCSAADQGWNAAVKDRRVSAVLLLDGISFTGPWYHYARTLDRLRQLPRQWKRMLGRMAERVQGAQQLDSSDFRDWPTHDQARRQFAALVARDVRLLWIFTGGYTDRFLHPRQFKWAFGGPALSPGVAMHYWPDCDHIFFSRAHRNRLLDTVEQWITGLTTPSGERT